MKIAAAIARYLLAITFLVFGLNGFLNFIPQPPMQPGPGAQFIGAMAQTHYLVFVCGLQLIVGLLFLVNRYVPLALTLIAPVIVNILLFHGLMDPGGIGAGLFVIILWLILAHSVRSAFAGILQQKIEPER
jgi:putative oxidoreductase